MASNPVAMFFTRILRSDKKDNSKQATSKNRKRQSAPVSDCPGVPGTSGSLEKQQRLQQGLQTPDMAGPMGDSRAAARKTGAKQQVKSRDKRARKSKDKTKRNSSLFASLFCMAGNTDTLERKPLPSKNTQHSRPGARGGGGGGGGKKGQGKLSNQKRALGWSNEMLHVDVVRREDKTIRDKSNRHSAPVHSWISAVPNGSHIADPSHSDGVENLANPRGQVSAVTSPVRYRVDGTLEKPYVFPAGLTFMAGRRNGKKYFVDPSKLDPYGCSRRAVAADVHSCSEDEMLDDSRYRETFLSREMDCTDSSKNDSFDTQKEFYLKYDSQYTKPDWRRAEPGVPSTQNGPSGTDGSMSNPPLISRVAELPSFPNDHSSVSDSYNLNGVNVSTCQTTKRTDSGTQEKEKSSNWYSTPPKQSKCVYMGSFENLSVLTVKRDNTPFSKMGDSPYSKSKIKTGREKQRYSRPPKNRDYVYMGSFENLTSDSPDNTRGKTFRPALDDSLSACAFSMSLPELASENRLLETVVLEDSAFQSPQNFQARGEEVPSLLSGDANDECDPRNEFHGIVRISSDRFSSRRHSAPKVLISDDLSLASVNQALDCEIEKGQDKEEENEDEEEGNDVFHDTAPEPFGHRKRRVEVNTTPFSRNIGRASCMPGNKRFFLPPPPCYTPPKEEMDGILSKMTNLSTNTRTSTGSQTDLNVADEHDVIAMEDRDQSLEKSQARTMASRLHSNTRGDVNVSFATPAPGALMQSEKLNRDDVSKVATYENHWVTNLGKHLDDDANPIGLVNDANPIGLVNDECVDEGISSPGVLSPLPKSSAKENSYEKCLGEQKVNLTKTSTPKCSRKVKTGDEIPKVKMRQPRPIPAPRTRYSAIGLVGAPTVEADLSRHPDTNRNHQPPTSGQTKEPPVPKQRSRVPGNITATKESGRQRSIVEESSPNEAQRREVDLSTSLANSTFLNNLKKTNGHRSNRSPTRVASAQKTNNGHVYEEVDDDNFRIETERIYEECSTDDVGVASLLPADSSERAVVGPSNDRTNKLLPSLETMQLLSSPTARRRCLSHEGCSNFASRPLFAGLSSSCDFLCALVNDSSDNVNDDNSVADDEMSNEDLRVIRRATSMQELLRSGSILDRSLILARKRKARMRQRKCVSQVISSTETDEGSCPSRDSIWTGRGPRANKSIDSGNDSELPSPCTSPNTLGFPGDFHGHEERHDMADGDTGWRSQRETSIQKKAWELRLRRKQWLRRARSKEFLYGSNSGLGQNLASKVQTIV